MKANWQSIVRAIRGNSNTFLTITPNFGNFKVVSFFFSLFLFRVESLGV